MPYDQYGNYYEDTASSTYDPGGSSVFEPTTTSYDPGDWYAPAPTADPAIGTYGLYSPYGNNTPVSSGSSTGTTSGTTGTGTTSGTSYGKTGTTSVGTTKAGTQAITEKDVYSYTATAPTTQTSSNTTTGSSTTGPTTSTSITGPSTSTQVTGPSTSTTTVDPTTATQIGTTTSTSSKTPTMDKPALQETADLTLPAMDAMRERYLAQEEQALGVGEWRNSLRQGLNKIMSEGNFASRGSQMRALFEGAGEGLGKILQSASSAARTLYAAEYAIEVNTATANWNKDVSAHLSEFQADVSMYLGTMNTTTSGTTSQTTETSGGGSTTSNTGSTATGTSSGGTTTGTTSGGEITTTGNTTGTQNTSGGDVFKYTGTEPYAAAISSGTKTAGTSFPY